MITPDPTPGGDDDETIATAWIATDELQRAQQVQKAGARLIVDGERLRWITNAEIGQLGTDALAAITAKRQTAARRTGQTITLENVDEMTEAATSELRTLMKKKLKKDYQRYYKDFGFVPSGKNWILPIDRDKRAVAIHDLLLSALLTHGMGADPDTGTAVWQDILDVLAPALTTADTTKRGRTEQVATTTPQSAKVEKALRAIIHLVKAQWPDEWQAMLRVYGFVRESN
ncbi:MAG: hypothetical protein H7330_06540 [Hymenobacteraceae bacterium]|nr:hypothetical protein [Hymenobacteraceae bacterium]